MTVAKHCTVFCERTLCIVPAVPVTPTRRELDARAEDDWSFPLKPTGSFGMEIDPIGPRPLTADQAAARLGVCRSTVHRMLRNHQIDGLKFRDNWYVSPWSVRPTQPTWN